jgi:hypothetical protein
MGNPIVGDGTGGLPGVTGSGTTGSSGVLGISDSGFGVTGVNTTNGIGVNGDSISGEGVRGTSASGNGIHGINGAGSGTTPKFACGVRGESASGYGLYGASEAASGVYGETTSQQAYGISGVNNSQWPCIAILGTSNAGHGIRGTNGAGSGSQPDAGCGVWGDSRQGNGVYGSSKSGNAGMFEGNVVVTGKIDAANIGVTGKIDAANVAITGNIDASNVTVTGNIHVAGDVMLTGADCAEQFDLKALEVVEPGTVMVIDDSGALRQSEGAYDRRVAGVVSGAGIFRPGIVLDQHAENQGRTTIALVGKVYCKVDADLVPIAVGDLLTSSDTPGHAMKATDPLKGFGSVIGKALRPLQSGRSLLPILVALQ